MQCDGFRATIHIECDGTPQYVPPALRGDTRTYRGSQQPHLHHSEAWRDLLPHRDPPQSPNWRAPSPNHPTTFQSYSPPPQSPPTPPICPDIPSMPPRIHTESRLTFELVSLIKTTLEALQNVVRIAKRLIRQVNVERRLAHKPWRTTWSSHEDVYGNTVCPQPLCFLLGGVPVTGSLGGSEVLA
jgi:hypothetical protein